MESKWIKHYSSDHRILLVGEGDFSFALSLATAFGDASKIVATSLDSEAELATRHPTAAAANLVALKEMGCTIIHELDVRNMSEHPLLRLFDFSKLDSRKLPLVTNNKLFNRIVFNFPHAISDFKELDENQTQLYKDIIQSFLRNARDILCGEVHVTTYKKGYPFGDWKINQKLGKEVTMKLVAKVPFSMADYPGYVNRRGGDNNATSNDTFPVGECSTFKFVNLLIYYSRKRTKDLLDDM